MARETGFQSQVESYQNLKKMVREGIWLISQNFKARIKKYYGAIQWKKRRPPLHFAVVANEKGIGRVFASGPGHQGLIPDWIIPKIKKQNDTGICFP